MVNSKTIQTAVVLMAAMVQTCAALTVNWATGLGVAIQTDNSFVPAGSLVRLGTFTVDAATIALNQTDIAFLNSKFVQFGSGFVGDNVGGADGFWSIQSVNLSVPNFVGKRMYMWVFNAPSTTSATEHGIFTAPNNLEWIFKPDQDDIGQPLQQDIALDQVGLGPDSIVVGSVGPKFIDDLVQGYRLAIIPEPTTAVLVGVALLGAACLRRRSS